MAVPKPKEKGDGLSFKGCKTRTLLRIVNRTGCKFTKMEIERRRACGRDRHLPRSKSPSDEDRERMRREARDNPKHSPWAAMGDLRPWAVRRQDALRQEIVNAGSLHIGRAFYYFSKMGTHGCEIYEAAPIPDAWMKPTNDEKKDKNNKPRSNRR